MFNSKKSQLVILGALSLICSGLFFALLNDPEGPNLLVIFGMAMIVYFPSLGFYLLNGSFTGIKKLLITILIQLVVTVCFYFFLS